MRSTAVAAAALPRLYLGTMTFGWKSQTSSYVDERIALEMTEHFIAHNRKCVQGDGGDVEEVDHYIDTARIYAGGKTEKILGHVLSKIGASSAHKGDVLQVGTKAHPSQPGGLSPKGIQDQIDSSIEAMDLNGVKLSEYYLHQPDTENSLLESLETLHGYVTNGVIATIGMSNYHASEVQRAFDLCDQHSLTPPKVYQGIYNPLNRNIEDELLPILRKNGATFVAYNPLAAGLLTGKHTDPDKAVKGRFKNNKNYLPRFYTKSNFEALELIRGACDEAGITLVEATFRWLLRHSALKEGDGVLLGASSLKQLGQNLDACAAASRKGPLPDLVLDAFEKAWILTKPGSFPYWRSYSKDMPGRENLDQGASYDAIKKK